MRWYIVAAETVKSSDSTCLDPNAQHCNAGLKVFSHCAGSSFLWQKKDNLITCCVCWCGLLSCWVHLPRVWEDKGLLSIKDFNNQSEVEWAVENDWLRAPPAAWSVIDDRAWIAVSVGCGTSVWLEGELVKLVFLARVFAIISCNETSWLLYFYYIILLCWH